MSFTTEVKNEVAVLDTSLLDAPFFLSGFIRNNRDFSKKYLVLMNENPKIIRKVFMLLKDLYEIIPEIHVLHKINFQKRLVYQLVVHTKLEVLYKDLMITDTNGNYLSCPNEYFVDSDDFARSYLRGVFLAVGSVNDPKKSSYHLELLVNSLEEANYIISLMKRFFLPAKVITRDKGYMIYMKESEKISDFLRVISANRAVLYYEDIRIYRDHKNMTNRLNNCEQANVDKMIAAAKKQIQDIDYLLSKVDFELLPDKLKDIISYRKKYPELSLEELSSVISYETGSEITKSGLNHRFRKIKTMVEKLKENEKELD